MIPSSRYLLLLMYMLTMSAVLTDTSMDATFSSKLIHRFSKEAKDFTVSRNGKMVMDWPKYRSREYYELLVSNDLERQKMKLGKPKYKFLFPSKGSETMSFGNDWGWLHYSWVDIGTPNVSFLVALDTGSDLLWLPCECIECAPLSASNYSNLDRDLSEYAPSKSSTSKHLHCSHEFCELGPNCKNPKLPCPYIRKYLTENTTTSGFLVEDTIHLAANSDNASKSSIQAPVIIGCGREQSGGYLSGVAPDGLMGLGPGDVSVPSVLARAGLMKNSFSMCFNDDDDSGRIFFGDQGAPSHESTPFLPFKGTDMHYMVEVEGLCIGNSCLKQSRFQAQVDSGTSFTFIPDDVYKKVAVEFDKRINATRVSYEGSPWEYCYEGSSKDLLKLPTLTLMFTLNNSFVVHNPFLLIYDDQEIIGCCLAVQSTEADFGFIGQNFMTGYRIVFDREKSELRWSRSNCDNLLPAQSPSSHVKPENPLPTNEQQTPHGQAVAPAVAGRTPPNPSAAGSYSISSLYMLRMIHLLLPLFISISCM